jgi:threonylcarbamoyladenosine tRNA methylthiotransferase MtaB
MANALPDRCPLMPSPSLQPTSPAFHSPEERDTSLSARTVAFYTLGCKANQLETSTLATQFADEGWQVVPFDEAAEVYVINTCTVTERSDQESRRMIRRARLSNPQARIAVTGCYAQVSPDELAALEGVSFVIGNNFKEQLIRIVTDTPASERPLVQVSEIDKSRIMTAPGAA